MILLDVQSSIDVGADILDQASQHKALRKFSFATR
jgi:hypothetical protein